MTPRAGQRVGQLPGLHGVRDRLPVGRAVRQAHRGHARAGRAPLGAPARRAPAPPGDLRALPAPRAHEVDRPVRAAGAARAARFLGRFPRLKALAQLAPPRSKRVPLPEVTPGPGHQARPRRLPAGLRAARVLRRRQRGDGRRAGRRGLRGVGARRSRAAAARCSCTPAIDARDEARETIAAFEGCDTIVVNAAGCGSAMKDYGHLFRDDPEWSERAAAFSAKVRDVHELLAEHEPQAARHPVDLDVAYHDACHLAHAQGVRAQPRALLRDDPRPRAARARRVGAVLRLGRRLQPAQPRAGGRARPAQGAQPARHRRRGRRRRQPRLRAADRRPRRRCPSTTRWSCSPPRSTGGSHDRRRPRPRPRRRRPHRRRARLPRRAARALRAAPARAARARARSAGRGSPPARRSTSCPRRATSARATGRSRRRPPACSDRRVEITGPVDRKMVINALNSGARGFMADFEDSHSPTWANIVAGPGQPHRRDRGHDRVHRRRTGASTGWATRWRRCSCARAAGTWSRSTCASTASRSRAPSSTSGLYLFRNAQRLLEKGSGPYFYLPKMESHLEARLWTEAFAFAEGELGLDPGHGQGDRAHRDAARRLRDGGDPLRAARPLLRAERRPLGLHLLDDQDLPRAARSSSCPTATT